MAGDNPVAAFPEPRSAAEIATPGPRNRLLAYPYNRWHASQWTVDQSSALVICSAERARRAGVPAERWLFPHVALHCSGAVTLTARRRLWAWPAMAVLGAAAERHVGRPLRELHLAEVYSCFPAAVRVQQHELGLPRSGTPTLTGGMTFAGGPFNHFVLQSLLTLGRRLRDEPDELGLVTTVSGMLSKPGLALWSATPPSPADGTLLADLAAEAAAATEIVPVVNGPPAGATPAVVASFTVTPGAEMGPEPVRTAIVADLPDGVRTAATCEDADTARLADLRGTDRAVGRGEGHDIQPVSASPPRPGRPRLVDPELAARVPGLRRVAGIALGVGALSAVIVVVQAVALAHVVDRSLLHHTSLGALAPAIVIVGLAIVARAALHVAGDHSAHGAADRVVSTLRGEMLRHAPGARARLAGRGAARRTVCHRHPGAALAPLLLPRYLPQAAAAAVIPVILLAWVATQDWLSFAVVVALVIAVPITMIGFGRESTRRSERQWRRLGSLAGRFLQLIEGLPTLRAFGREHHGRREVAAATEGVRAATMRTLRVAFLSALSMDMIAGFGVGFVAMVLGLRLLWGELGLQTAMAVLLVAPEIFIPLRRAGAEFHASTEGQAASARVVEVLATGVPAGTFAAGSGAATARPAPRRDGRGAALTVDWLRVDYEHRDHPALASFSLHVPPGTRLALTGPSGCGKSTVLAALLRFVEPAAGTIALDGRPSGAIDAGAWRSYFSWLPQRPHLFNATLAENLRLGARDAPDADLQSVLAAVGLSELLANLPAGLGTALGHDGLTLSSGERQRVALARALLCPAPILLLDEPTASLDPPTVARLAPAVEPWLEGRMVIVAAHEPVLLPRFDAIVAVPAAAGLPLVVSP